jgi:hypothetical protein
MVAVAVAGLLVSVEAARRYRIAKAKALILAAEYRDKASDARINEAIAARALSASEDNKASNDKWKAIDEQEIRDLEANRDADRDVLIPGLLRSIQRCQDWEARLAVAVSRWRIKRDYYAALRIKYERAARYPWLPVAPDPPEPE